MCRIHPAINKDISFSVTDRYLGYYAGSHRNPSHYQYCLHTPHRY